MTVEHTAPAYSAVESPPTQRAAAYKWRRALREPLLHFVLIGLVLFVAGESYRQHTSTYRIEVTPQRVQQLARRYQLQFGAAPSAEILNALVDDDIREEILFREGLTLELDRDDEIVRRRIVQKTRFLLQDMRAPAEPTSAELEHYYQQHRARYALPEKASFSHIYFSAERGDAAAQVRALAVLQSLSNHNNRAPQLGDAFSDLYDFAAYDAEQIARLFGQTELAQAISSVPLASWSGPFRSAYGWHLVYVAAREAARQAPLSEVSERVRTDYLLDAQARANAAAFDEIARKFTVVRQQQ